MARGKTRVPETELPMQPRTTCNDCSHAYDWCCPAHDGTPICLRCEVYPQYLKLCSQPSCGSFDKRNNPAPDKTNVRISENKFADKIPDKVVPLFRPGEKEPWKIVKSKDIPPEGISWTGEPFKI